MWMMIGSLGSGIGSGGPGLRCILLLLMNLSLQHLVDLCLYFNTKPVRIRNIGRGTIDEVCISAAKLRVAFLEQFHCPQAEL